MYALVDGNNFYVSCERSFNPSLENRPAGILSNNDGCLIARSNELKALGVKMGTPFFELKEQIEEQNIAILSSNYTLYADMSARLMSTLNRFVEDVEVYSIDEAFLQLEGYEGLYPNYVTLGHCIRDTVQKWLRLPVGIGIAPTKTLAKVANKIAKQNPDRRGVCELVTKSDIDQALQSFDVGDLWGVGRRYASMLKRNGITTAAQLRDAPDDWINQHMTVNGLRLAYELRGTQCRLLEINPPPKKAICAAPSFGKLVPDLATVQDALTSHLARAAEKLRKQESLCGTLTVFLHTNRHRITTGNGLPAKQYYNSRTVELPHPTSSTPELLRYALSALESIFQFGYNYQKVGLILTNLVPADYRQKGVFVAGPDERQLKLAKVIDKLNYRHGRDQVRLASQVYNPDWPHKRQWVSPCYTTRWQDILKVR